MDSSLSTPSRVHHELICSARRIIADHWPSNDDGPCPICRVPECEALAGALRYLESFAEPALSPPYDDADLLTVLNRLEPAVATRLARRICLAHQPGQSCCPVCRTPECTPFTIATTWLIAVDDLWLAERWRE